MKKIAYFAAVAAMLVGFSSCNDEFLDLSPKGSITDATAFKSYESCYAYLLTLYEVFGGDYGNLFPGPAPVVGPLGTSTRDTYSGLLDNYGSYGDGTVPNSYAAQTVTIPTTSNAYSLPYKWIRKANIMLAHIDEPNVSDSQRKHLESLSRFFRAYSYFCLLANYGDVIYADEVLTESSEELQKARDSRALVTDRIYKDLLFCEENIQDNLAEGNTVNSTVVKAFLSRFCLFEGTWRKYHNVADEQGCVTGQQLLEKCLSVSKEIADRNISLYTGDNNDKHPGKGWGQMWTTEDLSKVPSVFLYVKYVDNIKMHRIGHYEHIASASLEMPQATVDLYLTRDGLPIHNAGVKYYKYDSENGYTEGEEYDYANCDPYKTFRMRDPRLWQMVTPPYHVTIRTGADAKADGSEWMHDLSFNGKYDEFVSQFAPRGQENKLDGGTVYWWCPNFATASHQIETHKSLPSSNWAGTVLPNVPNIKGGATPNWSKGATQYSGSKAFQQGRSGYFVWKHVANWDRQNQNTYADISGKPQFKLEEVLLNYAEVAFELGKFNQSVADATINKLRARAEVGKMNVAAIDDSFDPDRDKTVDPVLWEIRRERLIELMGESFSFEDVRRWKKADWFVNKQVCGVWVDADNISAVNSKTGGSTGVLSATTKLEATPDEVKAQGGGHVYFYLDPVKAGKGWKDTYYLQPIPSEECLLNPNLTQNEGY